MSTLAVNEHELPMAANDLQALEQRVFRAVELLRAERDARATAEARIAELEAQGRGLEQQLHEREDHIGRLEGDLLQLQGERDQVRGRVERLLRHLDEFSGQ